MQPQSLTLQVSADLDGMRLDKALSLMVQGCDDAHLLGLSRSRLQSLIEQEAIRCDGQIVREMRAKVRAGQAYTVMVPEPVSTTPEPQNIPLDIVFEDEHLIVVNKPVGMVVHPAPGAVDGTLVNALLHHCRDSLSGIGGERRPGIVHRIDKDTSGLLVVAKSDATHQGLSEQFSQHTVERQYCAFVWRMPDPADPRLRGVESLSREDSKWWRYDTFIDRHRTDRTRMRVSGSRGKQAITRFCVEQTYADGLATKLTCQLETGRTHQIRVHLSHLGFPLIGDQTYGRQMKPPAHLLDVDIAAYFPRQALHAQTLGFIHPITQEEEFFTTTIPKDMRQLEVIMGKW